MKFTEDRWLGNGWASIDIEPVEANCFLPILFHLSAIFHFAMPLVIDTLDGFAADFELLGSNATIHLDNWTFSIAFEKSEVRDQVLTALNTLPDHYFPE